MASKILLADDSITIQKVVNLTFADEGIDVITVSNGEMAERRLSEINPDLVLADIFMPGKNGYELCQFIKDTPPYQNIPVVLLVGAFEPFDQSEARRVKADGHLTKPFESRTLVETVRKLIQNSRSRTGAARQSAAKQPQPIRDTRPLGPEPEQNAFIGMSHLGADGSQTSPQNGSPVPGTTEESSAPTAAAGAEPLGVDYHGLWEMGAAGPATDSQGNHVTGDLSFGVDLGNVDAGPETQSNSIFSSGFEVTAPQASPADTQPAASGFEFGFAESPGDARPESSVPRANPENESGPASMPFVQSNGSETTGFSVPSLCSGAGQDQVSDFRQVEAPEAPVPASEVSFELSPTLVESAEPAPDGEPAPGVDGGYFDLIPQESAGTTPSPASPQWSDRPEVGSSNSSGTVESGFDLAGAIVSPDRAPSLIDEEPLGDVFSQDKTPSTSAQETSFAIAEEIVTVDVRPPAGESF